MSAIIGRKYCMTLNQALDTTEWLEKGEINAIFNRLLKQVGQAESHLFEKKMDELEGHSVSVPERIQSLRMALESAKH